MGIFKRTVKSLATGESVTISKPIGTEGVKKVYLTSANLTYAQGQTDAGVNSLVKSANTNYQEGYYPLNQKTEELIITVNGIAVAEDVTIISEWE